MNPYPSIFPSAALLGNLPINFNPNSPRWLMVTGLLSGGLLLVRWYFQDRRHKMDAFVGVTALLGALLGLLWQFLREAHPEQSAFLGVLGTALVLVPLAMLFLPSDAWYGQPPAVALPREQLNRDLDKAKLLARFVAQGGKVTVTGGTGLLSTAEYISITQLLLTLDQKLGSEPPIAPELAEVQQLQLDFAQLRAVAHPVTEETLLDTQRNPDAPRSRAALRLDVCGRYMLLAVVSLVLVQAYATIGVKLHGQMVTAERAATMGSGQSGVVEPGAAGEGKAKKEENLKKDGADVNEWGREDFFFFTNPEFVSAFECVQVWVNPVADFVQALGFAPRAKVDESGYTILHRKKEVARVRTQAELLIDFLNKYLLPLLYGWAGAAIYAVRQLTRQVSERTYREGAEDFAVRTWLGCAAGLAIGWFNVGKTVAEGGTSELQLAPLALAFLAGFAVEILFSVLDRLVRAFAS